ncbi:MAG: DUF711 family protein [Anaerolineae bacterium]|nr:DUF711 family protein [Anaerolineae bacterium]
MKIRSITCFATHENPDGFEAVKRLGAFANACAHAMSDIGVETQSTRFATQPFPEYLNLGDPTDAMQQVQELEKHANDAGFLYLSIGTAPANDITGMAAIPEMLANSQNVFATCQTTTPTHALSMPAVLKCADVIITNAKNGGDGFTNLRFAALANVDAHVPFFPAAFHDGGAPACGLAMECADVVLGGLVQSSSLSDARQQILGELEQAARMISNALIPLCEQHGVRWLGFDFSPAPFPTEWCSLAAAIERMGGMIGQHGALASAAWVADMLDAGRWQRCGFNGLMLPVLEDARMAERTRGGQLTTKDLLMYSAVCGTGLDTVPLPGGVTRDQIAALLMDISALALRLDKPLTARLMPIPGLTAGERTQYDFTYFINGEVMRLDGSAAGGWLQSEGPIPLSAKRRTGRGNISEPA